MGRLVLNHDLHSSMRGGARLSNTEKKECFDVVLKSIHYEEDEKVAEIEIFYDGNIKQAYTLSTIDPPIRPAEGVSISLIKRRTHFKSAHICYSASLDWNITRSTYTSAGELL